MRTLALALVGGVISIGLMTSAGAAEPSPLNVGAAKIEITPRTLNGLNPMPGEFTGVHDPIYVRALVVRNADTKIAFLVGDLIEAGDMTLIRRRIETELGIAFDHIMITATHNHSAPRIGKVSPGALAHAGGPESDAYSQFVFDRMIEALKQAEEKAQPARFGQGNGSVDVNVNRHLYTAAGWTLGSNVDGPSDKTLRVTSFETPDGKPIAVLFNYAVHSTVTIGINEITDDLAGAAARRVETGLGGDTVALFTPGALGDQAPKYFKQPQSGDVEADRSFAYEAMNAQGFVIGSEAVRVAQNIPAMVSHAKISASERVLACPAKAGANVMDSMKQERVDAVDIRLSLLRIGDIAFAGVNGEVVTTIYERLRNLSPLKDTVLVSIANDRIGYIPSDDMFDAPVFAVNGSPVARGCAEENIVNGIVEMIRSSS